MDPKIYTGLRFEGKPLIFAGSIEIFLPKILQIRFNLPGKPDWGSASPGAQTLAMLLLLDATSQLRDAVQFNLEYVKERVITWPSDKNWFVRRQEILSWLDGKKAPPKPPVEIVPELGELPQIGNFPSKRRKSE